MKHLVRCAKLRERSNPKQKDGEWSIRAFRVMDWVNNIQSLQNDVFEWQVMYEE